VWSESQKQQREKRQKFKFLTQDSEKVYCMRHKKSKQSFCADKTERQKKKLRKKSSARTALERG
jgi:hypothetical protein